MPKYQDIEQELIRRIQKGIYKAGAPFPNQNQLAKEFNTTRMTVQKALSGLFKKDLIYTQQGAGTYVKVNARLASQLDASVDQYVGTTKLMGADHEVESQILKFEIRFPNEDEQEQLYISANEPIYDIQRVRIVDKMPSSIEYTNMPVSVIPGLSEEILKKSIYHYIENDLKKKIGAAYRIIGADHPQQFDIDYLKCKKNDPILKVRQVVFLQDGTPFEYSETRHRHDKGNIMIYLPGNNF
ncbi:GntR family transcriptional regulator [Xylocopilactobacillus apicola]|uniref:GntR family transcriptional regulator n=1 Tax=Xylocopilactobacillus apicola TaxID=2932184 RepID=A0AAU9D800_9LACO|nr:GntR family transcriptional regulator [Xylocopilactobacillus apicola]BDR57580.1 GntR family transcriptional regulator [Xylocopilactobacillus apicola]